jgi:glutamine amidotransferase
MIVILDYGVGNLLSIKNMFKKTGNNNVLISNNLVDIKSAEKIILPGVGHFDYGMLKLKESGLIDMLQEKCVVEKTPILGICLGAQLLTNGSEEGNSKGLGLINAETIKFKQELMSENLPIPNMGWCATNTVCQTLMTSNLSNNQKYYFVHSYHMSCFDNSNILFESEYGYKFTSGIFSDNIYGVQFHPEKSHKFGMKIIENFSNL